MPLRPHGWWLPGAAALLLWNGVSDASLYDTGELTAAAWTLGGSHPPGQPLHAVLGHLASLVPMGPIPWRVTALSVLGALVACWITGRLAGAIIEHITDRRNILVRAVPDAAAFGTLLAPPVLRQATRPEVYAPALALTAGAFLALWLWATGADGRGHRGLRWAALAAGLVTALHPPHALPIFLAALVLTLALRPAVLKRPRAIAWALAFGLLGLVVHAYLPVRAAAGASMWGDPSTLDGFWEYISGRAYRGNLGADQGGLALQALRLVPHALSASGFIPVVGLAAFAAMALRTGTGRRIALVGLILPAVALTTALLQPIEVRNPDNVAYMAPAVLWLVAVGAAGVGAVAVAPWGKPLAAVALVPLALNPVGLVTAPQVIRADSPALGTLGAILTQAPPPRALVVVRTDAIATSWWEARAVEGARPDVALLATGLATSSWHWSDLKPHPMFEGLPVRGPADDPREAYVQGAVMTARMGVSVASEPRGPVGGRGRLAGPYLILGPHHRPADNSVDSDSIAERLAPHLDAEIARGPEGDFGAAGNVMRSYQLEHARRLIARSAFEPAFDQLARALPGLPTDLRERIRSAGGPLVSQPPPVVQDPGVFMTSPGDVQRETAALLWATGDTQGAMALLEAQLDEGDPRSLLQLAWIHLHSGRAELARQSLSEFLRRAPELADEATPLARHLDGFPAP